MNTFVRKFKSYLVEGHFVSLIATIIVLAMRALLFLRVESNPVVYKDTGYLWHYLSPLFIDPLISCIASTLSVFLIAILISVLNNRFALLRSRSALPYIIPLFLLSFHPYFLVMTADYGAIILILLAFFPLLQSYQSTDATLYSFRSGVLIGFASLFQIYALALLPLWWQGERTMRGHQFRSFMSSLLGLSLLYISIFTIFFLLDDLTSFLAPFLHFASITLPLLPDYSWMEWVYIVLIGVYFISNMVLSIKTYSRDKVLTLSFMRFLTFLILFLLFLQVTYWQETLFFLTLSIALISYLNAYFYTRTQSTFFIYLAFVIGLIFCYFYLSHFIVY
jgi:hypothetical protein